MKALKWILIVLGVLVLAVVLVLGWAGFVPGLSNYIGPKPVDLGVEFSADAAYSGAESHGMPTTRADLEAIIADPEAAKRFDSQFTADEACSLLAMGQTGIPNFPMRRVQVRFNPDGTGEGSAVLDMGQVPGFLGSLGVPQGEIDEVFRRIPVRGQVAFYAAGTCSITNNTTNLSLSEIRVGRFTVPADWYQGNEGYGTKYIDGALNSNGYQIESLTLGDGVVNLNGTRPLSSMEPWLHIVTSADAAPNSADAGPTDAEGGE